MFLIKTFLTGLIGISLCTADISGIVTDTSGTVPISGAIVTLENGGQTATTGSDGRFTLILGNADILPGNSKLSPNGLSARIAGNLLTVTIAKRSAVEVTTFDLIGNVTSKVRKTLEAGSNSIALPQLGVGVYFYKVKAANNEFVLKGNAVGGIPSGSAESSSSTSPNHLAKQAKASAKINDVIAATIDGYLNYRCVQYNSDTSGIVIKMIANAGDLTDVDGNVYQTVKIGNQVWMTENLRVTKYNDGTEIPLVTGGRVWGSLTTPAYSTISKFGALYNWYAVHTGKLAPAGWHIPTDSEWTIMEKYMGLHGYNYDGTTDTLRINKIAKSLAAKTDWNTYSTAGAIGCDLTKNNSSGFSALPGGYLNYGGVYGYQGYYGYWWSASEYDRSSAYSRTLIGGTTYLTSVPNTKNHGFSVRLVRD